MSFGVFFAGDWALGRGGIGSIIFFIHEGALGGIGGGDLGMIEFFLKGGSVGKGFFIEEALYL